jgi:hypothetical protein
MQARFLHSFVRRQRNRLNGTSGKASLIHDVRTARERQASIEKELKHLGNSLVRGTIQAAYWQEILEQERLTHLLLHDLQMQCAAEIHSARTRREQAAFAETSSSVTSLVEKHQRHAASLETVVWQLSQDVRCALEGGGHLVSTHARRVCVQDV